MTIQQLEYVVAVFREGSFTKAASSCFVTQPTLSMQIQKLEEELGITIFDRSTKPLRPTAIGEAIIEQARQNIRGMKRIRELVQEQRAALSGELRLGVIPTLAPYLLPLFLKDFLKSFPEVNLSIEEQISEHIFENLKSEKLDIGLMASIGTVEDLQETPLFYESFVAYISDEHPLHEQGFLRVKDLDVNEMLLLEEGHCFRDQIIRFCSSNKTTESTYGLTFESGSLETLKNLVEQNLGYTLIPELAALQLTGRQQKLLRELGHPKPVRQISLLTRRDVLKKRLVDALQECITRNLPKHMRSAKEYQIIY